MRFPMEIFILYGWQTEFIVRRMCEAHPYTTSVMAHGTRLWQGSFKHFSCFAMAVSAKDVGMSHFDLLSQYVRFDRLVIVFFS
jgi:hypothetical protein